MLARLFAYQVGFIAALVCLLEQSPISFAFVSLLLLSLALVDIWRFKQYQSQTVRSLMQGLRSLNDGDFSISLVASNKFVSQPAIDEFNVVVDKLRTERSHLYQREMLLDKLVNSANVVTLLLNQRDTLVFCNTAARHFYNKQHELIGENRDALCQGDYQVLAPYLAKARQQDQDALIYLPDPQNILQAWHLTSSKLSLQGAQHVLLLIKPISDQLNKQELITWKKVVRVINHELNNSIAPISSLCHSGKLLANSSDDEKLARVFNGIGKRVDHLAQFVKDYSELAKVKAPLKSDIKLDEFFQNLAELYQFSLQKQCAVDSLNADKEQLEQVLINLIKNAWQANNVTCVGLVLKKYQNELVIQVLDNGDGMQSHIMQNAFTPYFSTKQEGSGIGLAICREIIEGHGGRIQLANKQSTQFCGLCVTLTLPITG